MVLRPVAKIDQQKATTNKTNSLILLEISNNPGQIGAYFTTDRGKTPQKYRL